MYVCVQCRNVFECNNAIAINKHNAITMHQNRIDNDYLCAAANYCVIAVSQRSATMCHRTGRATAVATQRQPVVAAAINKPQATATSSQSSTNQRFTQTACRSSSRWWQSVALLACLLFIWDNCIGGGVVAAPQSCILCDKDDLRAIEPPSSAASAKSAGQYEEFLFEHQVTRQDAIQAFKRLNQSSDVMGGNSCKTVTCTKQVMKYCAGPLFINDHCLCELGHTEEGLPFVPHICYVGEKIETPSVGSCFFFEEVKDCCCAPTLAKEWRHIAVSSTSYLSNHHHSTFLATLVSSIAIVIHKL